jgi:hypothetical protein
VRRMGSYARRQQQQQGKWDEVKEVEEVGTGNATDVQQRSGRRSGSGANSGEDNENGGVGGGGGGDTRVSVGKVGALKDKHARDKAEAELQLAYIEQRANAALSQRLRDLEASLRHEQEHSAAALSPTWNAGGERGEGMRSVVSRRKRRGLLESSEDGGGDDGGNAGAGHASKVGHAGIVNSEQVPAAGEEGKRSRIGGRLAELEAKVAQDEAEADAQLAACMRQVEERLGKREGVDGGENLDVGRAGRTVGEAEGGVDERQSPKH